MTWSEYVRIIKWNFLWILLITAVLTAAAASASIWLIDKEYDAKTVMAVTSDPSMNSAYLYEGLQANLDLINDYKAIVYTNRIIDQVKNELVVADPDFRKVPNENIKKRIIVETTPTTRVFSIIYRDTNPMLAQKVSVKLGEALVKEVSSLVHIDNLVIFDPATVPSAPSKPELVRNILLAAFTGFFGTLLLIFIYNYFKLIDKQVSV